MPNVFATNTTSASITVAGHKVYYIDSTDAEIVEVEGTSGQALPSVGDTVTFGNYPQATSTPEPIEWTVLAVDSVNGKALLIAKKVLDCQNFNSGNTNTTWETCSLRTWLNSTFLETAFNSTERGRILTTHIETPNNPSYPSISGGNATDDKVFLLSIQEANDTSYFENAAARKTLATQTAISNGIYEESGYAYWMLRSLGSDGTSVADILPDGVLSYSGLSTYSAPGNGIRPAFWLGLPPAIRRNAFKYSLSGTPYYYVIDGEHDTWTDDLSEWGYSEVQPVVTLPEVSPLSSVSQSVGISSVTSISSNGKTEVLRALSGSGYGGDYFPYENDKSYAAITYSDGTGWKNTVGIFEPSSTTYNGDSVCAKNVSSSTQDFYAIKIAVCSSNQATVVTVYNSSNVAYNAFKFTANNTDYYYVLDGTQTDWTDDLAGIGYHDESVEVFFYLSVFKTPNTFSENDYWGSVLIDDTDKELLESFGVRLMYYPSSSYNSGYVLDRDGNSGFTFEPIGLYSGIRTGDNSATMSNFYCAMKSGQQPISAYYGICIQNINPYSTASTTWKCRITKRISGNRIMAYMSSTKAIVNLSSGYGEGLYDDNGNYITYSVSMISDIVYYSGPGDSGTPLPSTGIVIQNSSSSGQVWITNNTGANITVQCLSFVLSNS